ncbi:MAG: phosphoglycolate phosphatase [Paraburkholderia sp.]|nr:phosphoglycolate phosphatase [Paraburkholderia sp.]
MAIASPLSNTVVTTRRPVVVLFDLDGTLADTLDDVTSALNDALTSKGLPLVDRDMVRGYLGAGGTALAQAAVIRANDADTLKLIPEVHARYLLSYHQCPVRHTRLYPGAREILTTLANRDVTLGVCTNKVASLAMPVLRSLGVEEAFGVIVCGDTIAHRKPSPEPVWHALRAVGAQAADAWLVGDTVIDQQSARASNATFIFANYGYGGAEVASPALSISSLNELDKLFPDFTAASVTRF